MNQSKPFWMKTAPTLLAAALAFCYSGIVAAAENSQELQSIQVIGKKKVSRKDKDVTGLGKIVKTSEELHKQQIENIRDLVRYDPGVSVVEQGRGGSSGFSIRGVDKNRVLVSVDGIAQIQSYADTNSNSGGSGSTNEIELENISAVEINKGGNGAEAGSGALGGSVNYYTKDVADMIPEGKNWGLTSKTVYSSRDKRKAQTVGAAARVKGFEGLVQYTYREGHETSIHKDAGSRPISFTRQGAYENRYDLRYEADRQSDNFYRMEDCSGSDCIRHAGAPTVSVLNDAATRSDAYSAAEEAQRRNMLHPTETLSAAEYTGPQRIKPNPMQYKTGSWLTRFGYRFGNGHYLGVLAEHTRQRYDSRDMHAPAYYEPGYELRSRPEAWRKPSENDPRYRDFDDAGNNDGVWNANISEAFPELLWTRARFLKENHRKQRQGIQYRYKPQGGSTWADSVELSLDRQDITLNTVTVNSSCAPYPTADINCRADLSKPGSSYEEEKVRYGEKHLAFNAKWQKKWQFATIKHDVQAAFGYDRFDSHFNRDYEETAVYNRLKHVGKDTTEADGKTYGVDIYRDLGPISYTWHRCTDWQLETCVRAPISGSSRYISLRDNAAFGKYLDVGLGLRYDLHRFSSDDTAVRSKTYRNLSWNTGIVFKPTRWLALSYRASNGFRVPSFQDLYGYTVPGIDRKGKYHYVADLQPETSLNREFGITLKGGFGNLEVSTFDSKYRGLIAYAIGKPELLDGSSSIGNFNLQNADLRGLNVRSLIDLNGIWGRIPEGLTVNLAYNRIKAKKLFISDQEKFIRFADYPLETIQPSRYVVGINYDAPSGKWGTSFNWTYSKAKDPSELISKVNSADGSFYKQAATKSRTSSWKVLDVIAYYSPWKQATVRAGIYNLFNYRYLTWETVRQSSINALAPHQPGSDYKRYAAPGRNFTLSLEMKF